MCLVTLQAYVPAIIFLDVCPFSSNVTRVGDETSDVTSVNTVLQKCSGKVVRLNIQFETTHSTTVEFNTTMELVVPMQRCNFGSAGTETIDSEKQRDISLYYQGVPHLYYFGERRGPLVKKQDCQSYNWRLEANISPI